LGADDVIIPQQRQGLQSASWRETAASSTRADGWFDIRDKIPFGLFSSSKESAPRPRQVRRKVKKRVVHAVA
jgi:hypothetical protein